MIDWLIDWLIEWVSEWASEWMSEWVSESSRGRGRKERGRRKLVRLELKKDYST